MVNIKHLEHKGIAFVTVENDAEVGHIIDVADTSGLHIHGTMIRVARAHQPSDGQVLPQPLSPAQPRGTHHALLPMQGLEGQNYYAQNSATPCLVSVLGLAMWRHVGGLYRVTKDDVKVKGAG